METTMTVELAWEHSIQDIPESGLSVERTASEAEREAIARSLDLIACTTLTARYAITPRKEGHFHLTGTLEARVEQACVVTLEPLTNDVAESFSVDYWPETELPAPGGGELDMHDEPDLEPIVGGRIAVGRVVFESLAGAIDLFPRKPGATFEPPQAGGPGRPESPFAALAKLKTRR
jgi:hypothetical protein